jgi:hypothetical protein
MVDVLTIEPNPDKYPDNPTLATVKQEQDNRVKKKIIVFKRAHNSL